MSRPAETTLEVGINVRNLEESLRFYEEVLGFRQTGAMSLPQRRIVTLRLDESVIKLVGEFVPLDAANPRVSHGVRAYGFYALAINVDDAESIVEKCSTLGYDVESGFREFPPGVDAAVGGGVGCVRDPDGNLIELVQGLLWNEP